MTATEGLSCLVGIALWLMISRKSLQAI